MDPLIYGGVSLEQIEKAAARVYARVELDAKTGCLLWSGAQPDNGYGVVSLKDSGPSGQRRTVLVHRAVVAHAHGRHLREDEHVHHICEVRLCVNLEHLQIVSPAEHAQIHAKTGESNPSWKSRCVRDHQLHGEEAEVDDRSRCLKCARERVRAWQAAPERKAYRRAYRSTPEYKARKNELRRARRAAQKAQKETSIAAS